MEKQRLERAWREFEQRMTAANKFNIPDKLRANFRGVFISGAIATLAELVADRAPGENPVAEMLEEIACFEFEPPVGG